MDDNGENKSLGIAIDAIKKEGASIALEYIKEVFNDEIKKLSQMRHTDKKHHDSILWMHIREFERRMKKAFDDTN